MIAWEGLFQTMFYSLHFLLHCRKLLHQTVRRCPLGIDEDSTFFHPDAICFVECFQILNVSLQSIGRETLK